MDPKNMKVLMTLGNPELIVHMVQSGMGISFVSKWSVFSAIKDGSIKLLHMPGKKFRRKFYLVSLQLQEKYTTVAARTFNEFIGEFKFFIPF
jgi:DNA-binding transcriptional LysR family regulator